MARRNITVNVIRIDPVAKTIALIPMKTTMDDLRRKLKASSQTEIGNTPVVSNGEESLVSKIMGKMGEDLGQPGFRFRGQAADKETIGLALLVTYGPQGGLVDCNVDIKWVRREIVWVDECYGINGKAGMPVEQKENDDV